MPVYEYACKDCGQHLEVAQSFKDEPLTTCPHCEGPLRKVFGSIGISFKGSGFYRTDSRIPSRKETPAKEKETAKAGAGSDSGSASSSGEKSGGDKAASSDGAAAKPAAKSPAKTA